jgi:hypothetical protein
MRQSDARLDTIDADEIDLTQLFQKIWSGRGIIAAVSLAFFLIVGIFFGLRFLSFTGHNTHEIQLRFTFNGTEKGQYPNKTQFRLSDIVSSQTLHIIYEKYNLKGSGLAQTDFINNISIRPAAINRAFIDAKYKSRLGGKGLSQTEIAELENAYQLELAAASHRAAILTYTSYQHSVIADALIEKILFDIPAIWSRLAINEHGVLDLPVISVNAMHINTLKDEEYAIGTARIRDNILLLTASLDLLGSNERIALVRDPQSGLTVQDLNTQLQTFKNYRLEPLNTLITSQQAYRNQTTVKIFLESKLQSFQDQLDKTLQKASIYNTAFKEHSKSSINLGAGLRSPTATTEIGDTFFAHLLKLGDEVSASKYRQELTAEYIRLKLKAEDIKIEITLLNRQLRGIKKPIKKSTTIIIDEIYEKTIAEFLALSHSYSQLMTLARIHALSNNGSLFEALNNKASITSFNKIQLKRVITTAIVALIIGAMMGIFIALLRKTNPQQPH